TAVSVVGGPVGRVLALGIVVAGAATERASQMNVDCAYAYVVLPATQTGLHWAAFYNNDGERDTKQAPSPWGDGKLWRPVDENKFYQSNAGEGYYRVVKAETRTIRDGRKMYGIIFKNWAENKYRHVRVMIDAYE